MFGRLFVNMTGGFVIAVHKYRLIPVAQVLKNAIYFI